MKKLIILISIVLFVSCNAIQREVKNMQADFGGIKRDIILLDYQGDTLETFSTEAIYSDSGSSVYFEDSNHKRILISGGIIIAKEQ